MDFAPSRRGVVWSDSVTTWASLWKRFRLMKVAAGRPGKKTAKAGSDDKVEEGIYNRQMKSSGSIKKIFDLEPTATAVRMDRKE